MLLYWRLFYLPQTISYRNNVYRAQLRMDWLPVFISYWIIIKLLNADLKEFSRG